MRKGNEKGAVIVEATIVFSAFLFMLFTIFSIINIYTVQARMAVALNCAAKEISQYSYLYFKFGADKVLAETDETAASRATAEQTIDGVGVLIDNFNGAESNISSGDLDGLIGNIENSTSTANGLYNMYAEQLKDPKSFIIGMGKMAAVDLMSYGQALLGQVMAKSFMAKNLKDFDGDNPEDYLKRYKVKNGMNGLDFKYTAILSGNARDIIQLVVKYDVEVIKLLGIDFKFTFRQVSKTMAWANGDSDVNPFENSGSEESDSSKTSIWDEPSSVDRGKKIIAAEKKKLKYTSEGKGFDGYDDSSNQFITISSADTRMPSRSTKEGMKNFISSEYKKLDSKVYKVGEEFEVTDKNGSRKTLTSDKESRKYKIIIVVPDNADRELINAAKKEFIKDCEFLGDKNVEVEFKTGYGEAKGEIPGNDS